MMNSRPSGDATSASAAFSSAGQSSAALRAGGVAPAAGPLQPTHPHIASHEALARQTLPPHSATAVAATASQPGATAAGVSAVQASSALSGRPVPQPGVATAYSTAEPMPYSAEAQALYRARAQAQPLYTAVSRPYASGAQPGGSLPPSYVSFSQSPYNVQTHTPYIASAQLPYTAQNQSSYRPQGQPGYGLQAQPAYALAQRYATAVPRYATAAAPAVQLRPRVRPPLNIEHITFTRLAPQPKNAIDIISEDAVLPTFPLKKKKPKKRKYAGLEAFAAEVHRHKQLVLDAKHKAQLALEDRKSPAKPKVTPSPPRHPPAPCLFLKLASLDGS